MPCSPNSTPPTQPTSRGHRRDVGHCRVNASAIPAHWSAVDRGPLTDDERHAEIVQLSDELDSARRFVARTKAVLSAAEADVAMIEAALRRRLAQPANQPTRRSR